MNNLHNVLLLVTQLLEFLLMCLKLSNQTNQYLNTSEVILIRVTHQAQYGIRVWYLIFDYIFLYVIMDIKIMHVQVESKHNCSSDYVYSVYCMQSV